MPSFQKSTGKTWHHPPWHVSAAPAQPPPLCWKPSLPGLCLLLQSEALGWSQTSLPPHWNHDTCQPDLHYYPHSQHNKKHRPQGQQSCHSCFILTQTPTTFLDPCSLPTNYGPPTFSSITWTLGEFTSGCFLWTWALDSKPPTWFPYRTRVPCVPNSICGLITNLLPYKRQHVGEPCPWLPNHCVWQEAVVH